MLQADSCVIVSSPAKGCGLLKRSFFFSTTPGQFLDPADAFGMSLMRNEKPGGHGERSVAVGVLDMAYGPLSRKSPVLPLYRLLADRYRGGIAGSKVFVYAAGGYYYPDKDLSALQKEMLVYLALATPS